MTILTVSQINTYIKSLFDGDSILRNVYIQGEISNFKNHIPSGHYYFSLKDKSSSISAAMFSRENSRLKFMPENGMRVIIRGRIAVYEKSGSYSIYADEIQPDGIGALYLAYEQLKARLEKENLFDPLKKKPLPRFPQKIGIITSGTGAALQDILNILSRRYPIAQAIVIPAAVQGETAATELANAVIKANREMLADVIIIGRGGGSIEDLWAFNDENLARTIAGSGIPVISAVGHETDFTIADFAADLRAPTPSAAAELAVPDMISIINDCSVSKLRMKSSILRKINIKKTQLDNLMVKPSLKSPSFAVSQKQMNVDSIFGKIVDLYKRKLLFSRDKLAISLARLESLGPLSVLKRGYSIVYKNSNTISSIKEVKNGDLLKIRLFDGEIDCLVCTERNSND